MKKLITFIGLALLLSLCATPVYATPALPHAFYGSVTINGSPAPIGTSVEARGTGVRTGIEGNPIKVTEAGKYGGPDGLDPKLAVQGDLLLEGATITFYVKGVSTGQTDTFVAGGGPTQIDLSVTIAAPSAPSGAGGEPPPEPAVTDVSAIVDARGVFTKSITAVSEDGNVEISIDAGTTGTVGGKPLEELSITWEPDPPEPPKDTDIVISYDLGPDGATFDPAITVTFHYDENRLPATADEEALTVAWYDASRGWVYFDPEDITIDPDTNTISVKVDHFTNFAVMALTRPAEFTVSNLTISPAQADIAQSVTVSADIANSGDLAGSYEVILKVNNEVESTKKLKIAGRTTEKVTFTVIKGAVGSYTVDINGQKGTFTVKSMAAPVTIPPTQPSITVPAPPAPAPTPAPAPPAPAPTPVPPTNWPLIGGIIAGVVIVGLLIYFLVFRRRAY